MLTKQTIISAILLPFVLLATWLLLQWLELPQFLPVKANQSDSYAINVLSTRMSDQGKPKDQLNASLVIHYPQQDTFDIQTPRLTIFQATGSPWHLSANQGQARNHIQIIDLWGDVQVERTASPDNPATNMTTQALTLYPKTQSVLTHHLIILEQPKNKIQAVGMEANLKNNVINLTSQVEGLYDQTTLKSDQLIIYFDPQHHMEKTIAIGHAHATQEANSYKGHELTYDNKTGILTSPTSQHGRTQIIINPKQKL